MNLCVNCQTETMNPKFCSRSCAASINNKLYPKRPKESFCKSCNIPVCSGTSRCKPCHKIWQDNRSIERYDKETLKSMRGSGNANKGSRYPIIRQLSRKKYLASGLPLVCKICNYDFHVDIAHIKEIKSFDEDTILGIINHIDNLVALCKNHHWELDHGKLILSN